MIARDSDVADFFTGKLSNVYTAEGSTFDAAPPAAGAADPPTVCAAEPSASPPISTLSASAAGKIAIKSRRPIVIYPPPPSFETRLTITPLQSCREAELPRSSPSLLERESRPLPPIWMPAKLVRKPFWSHTNMGLLQTGAPRNNPWRASRNSMNLKTPIGALLLVLALDPFHSAP